MSFRGALLAVATLIGASSSAAEPNTQNFTELCQDKGLNPGAEKTVQALLLSVGVGERNPSTCTWAEPRLKKLKEFKFGYLEIQDLSPLATLPNITSVEVYFSEKLNMQTIVGLSSLEAITLNSFHLGDLSPLLQLPNLRRLNLAIRYSDIESVSLRSLQGARLESLILSVRKEFRMTDLDVFASFKELKELYLNVEGVEMKSLSFLGSLLNLQRLVLWPSRSSEYHDLSPLSGMANLRSLELYNGKVSSLAKLGSLESLQKLTLSAQAITSIDGIAQLHSLQNLNLSANAINSIEGIEYLVNLRELELQENKITKLDPLAQLHQLTSLRLDSNQIATIPDLSGLSNLKRLSLGSNNISTISFLPHLPALESLGVQRNALERLPDFSASTRLTELYLGDNKISDLDPLAGCLSLAYLNVQGNPVKDFSPLYPLTIPHANSAGDLIELQIIE